MEYIKNTTEFSISEETAVSLGKFDGIHKGHVRLLEYLKEKKRLGQKSVVFTFDIPPRQRVGAWEQSKVLTQMKRKCVFLNKTGWIM